MTTAARPTFHPAKGGHTGRDLNFPTQILSSKQLPSHTKLKLRQKGQHSLLEIQERDLKAELAHAEKEYRRLHLPPPSAPPSLLSSSSSSSSFSSSSSENDIKNDDDSGRDHESKHHVSLQTKDKTLHTTLNTEKSKAALSDQGTRSEEEEEDDDDNDGDDGDDDEDESSEEDEDDDGDEDEDEDETAMLMRELEKIKKERAEEKERLEKLHQEQQEQQYQASLLSSNPLLATSSDLRIKRRWDEDVVFKNQARLESKPVKRFINDTIRSDFHRKFLSKYIK